MRAHRLRGHLGVQGLVVAATVHVFAVTAHAAEPSAGDRETSRSLYGQGMQALDAHDYPSAERACGGAYALVKAPTAATCWGRALEGLGRLVEARDVFVETIHLPGTADEPAVFVGARETARTEADQLAKRIPTVTLVPSGPPESAPLEVTLDGATIKPETARLPRKVNPGHHTLAVSAQGFEPARVDVSIAEGDDRRLEILLHPTGSRPKAPAATPPAPVSEHSEFLTLAVIAGGVGVAGLAVGLGSGLAAASKHSGLDGVCNVSAGTCPPSASGDLDSFHALRTASTVGYVVGALGLVAGGVIYFLVPRTSRAPSTGLYVGPTSCGLAGAF